MPMRLRFSFICAYANVSSSGNINASEIYADIATPNFPCSPRLMYVASTLFEPRESGAHKFRLTLINEDGEDVIKPIIGDISVKTPALVSNVILNFAGVAFPKPGAYQIDFSYR
jgi:hypothetical protein